MNTPLIDVGGNTGCIFRGEVPETYCFVPRDCLEDDGKEIRVVEVAYVAQRWDQRNMRSNLTVEGGNHLFPDPHRPVENLDEAPVQTFLGRLRLGTASPFAG